MHDVVIVGGGPAGITLALELADAGLDIALLESGDVAFEPDTQALYDGEVIGNDSLDLMAARLRFLGGTTNHWGGNCLPMDAIDFERRPLSGMSGWPFGRDTLDPYYVRAHEYLRLGAFDYSRGIVSGLADRDFLLPREPRIESVPLRLSRGPLRFGQAYGERLETTRNIDLQLRSNVVGLDLDEDDRITAVQVAGLDGKRRRVAGRVVVLACGAVENARLLMLANAAHGRRFGDGGGLLGKCYMDHPAGGAGFVHFRQVESERAYWSGNLESADGVPVRYMWRLSEEVLREKELVNASFFIIPFADDQTARERRSEALRAENAARSIAKWAVGRPDGGFELSQEYCAFITNLDSFASETITQAMHGQRAERVLLRFESEELPGPHNRITLSDQRDRLGLPKPVLHWAPGDTERDSMLRSAGLIGRICGEHDLGRFEFEDFDRLFWGTATSWHQMGTTRMAEAARDGVVDVDARVHGTRNLYVAGGSVMPTGGRANPTLTILALAIRLADHLQSKIARP